MDRTTAANFITVDGKRKFTEGPPATTIPADHLNAVQEELLAVIEGAGITPSANDLTQVKQAIKNYAGLQILTGTGNLQTVITEAIGDATFTVGPTGSGADIILTSLDTIPSGSRWVKLSCIIEVEHGADANGDKWFFVTFRDMANTTTYGYMTAEAYLTNDKSRCSADILIPLDSNRKFKFVWARQGAGTITGSLGMLATAYIA